MQENLLGGAQLASPLNSQEKIDSLPLLQGSKDGKGVQSNSRPPNKQAGLNNTQYSPINGQMDELLK